MNVKERDELHLIETQHGVMVTPYDPKLEKTLRQPGESWRVTVTP